MRIGLLPRVIAGAWFAVAACVPVGFVFLVFGRNLVFAAVPLSAASFFGFTLGAGILNTWKMRT